MERQFDWLDRAALAGAKIYRDLIWVIYSCAAFAVFAAVAGQVWSNESASPAGVARHPGTAQHFSGWLHPCGWFHLRAAPHLGGWAIAEVVSLVAIWGIVAGLRISRLQHRWTACRIGAEQLRLARMTLPLLVVPPLLLSQDRDSNDQTDRSNSRRRIDHASVALALVKRAIREQGPSVLRANLSVADAARWLRCIVDDQCAYHANNHDRLEAVDRLINRANALLFGFVVLVVMYHLFGGVFIWPAWHEVLLVTAAGPAAVGALHGAASRLEIVRRNDLSRAYAAKLASLVRNLDDIIARPDTASWLRIRELVVSATDAMGSEADAWHATMILEPVTLP